MFETLPGEPCDEGIACARVRQHEHPPVPVRSDVAESICNEAKAATLAFKGKPASFTASASQCLSLYLPLRYYISTLGVNNSAAYVSFISLVELLELLHHSMRKVIDAEERSVWFSLQGFFIRELQGFMF